MLKVAQGVGGHGEVTRVEDSRGVSPGTRLADGACGRYGAPSAGLKSCVAGLQREQPVCLFLCPKSWSFFILPPIRFLKKILFILREEGREKEGEKH